MSRKGSLALRIVAPAVIYFLFLLLIGELPSRPGAATIGLTIVWCGQVLWELRSASRLRRA